MTMSGALLSLCVSASAAGLLPAAAGTALATAVALAAAALYMRPLRRARQSRMQAEARLPAAAETPAQAGTAERSTPPAPRQEDNPPPAAALTRGDRLLLLVEDDVISQRAVIRQLGALGHAAHIANNGREALEAFAFHSYALVLMDCQMPVMDGFETTRRIRMLDRSRNRRTPVIALTANPTQSTRERCIAAGMEDCLAKPIQRAQLSELLEKYLPPPVPQHAAAAASFMFNLPRQRDIFGDDRARRQHMLERFAADSGPLIAQLGSAIAGADLEDIAARVRQLAGACASIGLDELTTLAQAAERAARTRNLRELGQIHRAMMAAFQRLSDFIAAQKSERA